MQCSLCKAKAVIYRKYEGRALCKKHFLESIEKKFLKTIRKYELVKRGDKVAVGISGGKDSATLLYLLTKFQDKLGIEVEAILINEGIEGYRNLTIHYAEKLASKLKIPLHIVSFKDHIGKDLDEMVKISREKKLELTPCTICGVFRRLLLEKKAKEIKATKLAIGHNLDDEAQSILANYFKGDLIRAARLGPKPHVIEGVFVQRIKPLIDIPEKEVALYALLRNLPVDFAECPYAQGSYRWDVRELINKFELKHMGTKQNIVRTYEKIMPCIRESLPKTINRCEKCGMPTSRRICKACEIKDLLNIN